MNVATQPAPRLFGQYELDRMSRDAGAPPSDPADAQRQQQQQQ
jgi:hypothetical protein